MILHSLKLKNFRGFREIEIGFDRRLTVLVGINGAGKSTILDALAILLDQYAARLLASRASARRLTDSDTTNGAPETRIRLNVQVNSKIIGWTLHKQGTRQKILHPANSELNDLNRVPRCSPLRRGQARPEPPEIGILSYNSCFVPVNLLVPNP